MFGKVLWRFISAATTVLSCHYEAYFALFAVLIGPAGSFLESRAMPTTTRQQQQSRSQLSGARMPQLVAHKMCPFVQKAWITLEASGIDYELVFIDLYGANGKPDWFWKLNPKGTVPVLTVNNNKLVLTDSEDIVKAVQDGRVLAATPELATMITHNLYPENAQSDIDAWHRRIAQMLLVGKQAVNSNNVSKAGKQLRDMNDAVQGPYLCGDQVTTADCVAFPFLWRLQDEFEDFSHDYPNLGSWLQHVQKQHAFRQTIQPAWWWWW